MLITPTSEHTLTRDEAEKLTAALGILRSQGPRTLFLERLLELPEDPESAPDAADQTLRNLADLCVLRINAQRLADLEQNFEHAMTSGLLIRTGRGLERLTQRELDLLQNTLTVFRRGGWLDDFLEIILEKTANAETAEWSHPSPAQIIRALQDDLDQWNLTVETARFVARQRPDLLPQPKPSAAPMAEPQPEEVTQDAVTKSSAAAAAGGARGIAVHRPTIPRTATKPRTKAVRGKGRKPA